MRIKDLKQPYKALALVRQKEQGHKHNEERLLEMPYTAFDWEKTKEGYKFWDSVDDGNYPPIPPDSLKDIPLQVRWDSGERFRYLVGGRPLMELHVFESGKVAAVTDYGSIVGCQNENVFFTLFEPIPSEPQTRWVNVWIGGSEYYSVDKLTRGEKNANADISVQQKLVNDKWVNVK